MLKNLRQVHGRTNYTKQKIIRSKFVYSHIHAKEYHPGPLQVLKDQVPCQVTKWILIKLLASLELPILIR